MLDVETLNSGNNRYAEMMGIVFTSCEDGRCTAEIEIRDDHLHSGMIAQGGVAYGLADSAMAHALMSACERGQNSSTVECKMSYLSPVTEGVMKCEAWIVKRGRNIAFLEAKVMVGERVTATASATFMLVNLK